MKNQINPIQSKTPLTDKAYYKLNTNVQPLPEGTKFVLYEDMLDLEVLYNKLLEKVKSNIKK